MARVSAVACVRMYLNTDKCRIPRNDFRDAGTGDFTALKCSNLKVSKISRVFFIKRWSVAESFTIFENHVYSH